MRLTNTPSAETSKDSGYVLPGDDDDDYASPSVAPSVEPTSPAPELPPSASPTREPTQIQDAEESQPGTSPEGGSNNSNRSTAEENVEILFVQRTIPFGFVATLERSDNATAATTGFDTNDDADAEAAAAWRQDLADIWQDYILARLQAGFRNDPGAYVQRVRLNVRLPQVSSNNTSGSTEEERSAPKEPRSQSTQPKKKPSFRGRLLQSTMSSPRTKTLQVNGSVAFQADQDRALDQLAQQTRDKLDPILTPESLQQALVLSEDAASGSNSRSDSWTVRSVEASYSETTGSSSSDSSSKHIPTVAELVIGFFLLFVAVTALAYTAYLLVARWRRRRKQNRQQQHQQDPALRKGSVVAKVPASPPPTSAPASPAAVSSSRRGSSRSLSPIRRVGTVPTSTDGGEDDLDFEDGTVGIRWFGEQNQKEGDDGGDNNDAGVGTGGPGVDNDDDEESEFGFQLRQAAYVDQAAWEDYQRRKQELAQQAAQLRALGGAVLMPTLMDMSRGVYADQEGDGVIRRSRGVTSNQEGLEVDALGRPLMATLERVRSFPYGDEKDEVLGDVLDEDDPERKETVVISPAAARAAAAAAMARVATDGPVRNVDNNDTRLNDLDRALLDSVEYTPTGMTLKSPPKSPLEQGDPDFEPYGDERKMTLQESWEHDDPVPPIKPGAFSFLYPLQRQHVSDSTKSTTDTQQSSANAGAPTSKAVRSSPTDSSWSTGAAIHNDPRDFPTLDRRELIGRPLQSYDEGENDDDDDDQEGTEQMLREVAMINAYVRRYEQQKRMSERVQADLQMRRNKGSAFLGNNSTSIGASTQGSTDGAETASKSYSAPYEAMDDSVSTQRRSPSRPATSVKDDLMRSRQQTIREANWEEEEGDYVGDPGFDPNLDSPSGSNEGEEDDASQRLGISRYAIQRPAAPIFSFTRSGREDPPGGRGAPSRLLSRLRQNRAVLDSAGDDGPENSSRSMLPFDERVDQATAAASAAIATLRPEPPNSSPTRVSPRSRSKNAEFNELLTMFESRPSHSIVPPTIHVSLEQC
jgi:hypothetical protein